MPGRPSGSAGGHNGLTSIQQALGTDGFPRLRLGIGPAAAGDTKSPSSGESRGRRAATAVPLAAEGWPDYVLAPFLPEEREVLGRVLARAADCVQEWLDGADQQTLMGTYNSPDSGKSPGA
jgi:PTH1 family peptidyl-tRNA hydrolase